MKAQSAADGASVSVWPHRLAVMTACATFPLLFIGGLVTSKGAGLAVPDWPTTFGYNMFLYPWSKMVGNIFYEHSHRLVASGVGLLTIVLALSLWLQERRNWLRWLGVTALVLVVIQGVLGGLRVILLEHSLAIVHASLAQAFFALAVSLALFTSAEWREKTTDRPLADYWPFAPACRRYHRTYLPSSVFRGGAAAYRPATRCPFVVCRAGNVAYPASRRQDYEIPL